MTDQRVAPGGKSVVLLGDDPTDWSTNSSAHGVGSAEAVLHAESRERLAPGGVDSIEFGKAHPGSSSEALLARPSPGGTCSINFSKPAPAPCPPRGSPGGEASIVLGSDHAEWSTNSGIHGVGGAEAAAHTESRVRQAPGGIASIDFGQSATSEVSRENLLARPSPGGTASIDFAGPDVAPRVATPRGSPGGEANVILGSDGAEWCTHSSAHGIGSAAAVASMEVHVRTAPGGATSIEFGKHDCQVPAEVLLARPSPGGSDSINLITQAASTVVSTKCTPGGEATIMLGGDTPDWTTNSGETGLGSLEAINSAETRVRPVPGGTASIKLGGAHDSTTPVDMLLTRSSPGGVDSIDFGSASIGRAETRDPSFGKATVLLGCHKTEWSTNSSVHGVGSADAIASADSRVRVVPGRGASIDFGAPVDETLPAESFYARPSPGGLDSIDFSKETDKTIQNADVPANWVGGATTIVLGSVGGEWSTDGGSYGVGSVEAVVAAEARAKQAPGGASTVFFGDDGGAAIPPKAVPKDITENQRAPIGGACTFTFEQACHTESSSANPRGSPGGMDSIAFGQCEASAPPIEELLARPSPGGTDSIDFEKRAPMPHTPRGSPGGATNIILGSDSGGWTTHSSIHGVGGAQAAALTETPVRPAPGGATSIVLGGERDMTPAHVFLTRPSPGGSDSINFADSGAIQAPTPRGSPGGKAEVHFGNEKAEWSTNSSIHGMGSPAAGPANARFSQAPGGTASIAFGKGEANALSAEVLLARSSPGGSDSVNFSKDASSALSATLVPRGSPGGKATLCLGGDDAEWLTHSSAHGIGSSQAFASAEVQARQGPGGKDSIDFGGVDGALSAEMLLARSSPGGVDSVNFSQDHSAVFPLVPPLPGSSPGGAATVVLGADSAEWSTNSSSHGVGACEAVAFSTPVRFAPGRGDSIKLGGNDHGEVVSAATLLTRPSPGGVASIDFANTNPNNFIGEVAPKGSPGGKASIVLGGDNAEWSTNSSAHGIGSMEAVALTESRVRPAPGGTDSIDFGRTSGNALSTESLLQRPAVGGSPSIILGDDGGKAIPDKKPAARHQAPGGTSTLVLGSNSDYTSSDHCSANSFANGANPNAGNFITDRPTTHLHHAPGGASTLSLGDAGVTATGVSANRFANGNSQNSGNCITDRSTTRLHQAPGGASTLVLGDASGPAVQERVSADRFANGNNQNSGNCLTERPSTRLFQSPGGKSTLCLGQNENTSANRMIATPVSEVKRAAPGGVATVVLG